MRFSEGDVELHAKPRHDVRGEVSCLAMNFMGIDWSQFITQSYYDYDDAQLPDYNDASNFIL